MRILGEDGGETFAVINQAALGPDAVPGEIPDDPASPFTSIEIQEK